jgi:hypothetical protein
MGTFNIAFATFAHHNIGSPTGLARENIAFLLLKSGHTHINFAMLGTSKRFSPNWFGVESLLSNSKTLVRGDGRWQAACPAIRTPRLRPKQR